MGASDRVAVVGCRAFSTLDDDWPLLREALDDAGVASELVAWDDPAVDWGSFGLVVLRGTWDSTARPVEFLAWARGAAACSVLANPVAVVGWNLDKRYLADLAAAGVPVVPTRWVRPEDGREPPPAAEFVVKPSISGGGADTARYGPGHAAQARAHVRRLQAAGRDLMVQEYQHGVDEKGELALVYFAGRFSHAVCKGPLLELGAGVVDRLWEREVLAPATPSPEQTAVALAAVAAVRGRFREPPTYGRVDLLDGPSGDPLVLEVELVDPSLFLGLAPGAPHRFAAEIARRLSTPRRTERGSA